MTAEFDRYGRYLITPADGGKPVAHTRATTWASTNDDQRNLTKWKLRTAANGIARRPDLLAGIVAAGDDDRSTLDRIVDQALEAGGSSTAANTGTALHKMTERVDRGEVFDIPEPHKSDVEAYTAALTKAGITIDLIEQICVCPELGVAGTFDRIVTFQGQRYIADLKTGRSLDYSWSTIAVQLALYAHASTIYDVATGTHSPMPEVDQERAIVFHLPAGSATCTLHWVDIEAGWRGALLAQEVRAWRKTKNLSQPLEAVVAPLAKPRRTRKDSVLPAPIVEASAPATADDRRAWLVTRILELLSEHPDVVTTLAQHWPIGVPTLKSDHVHSVDELDAIAAVLSKVEAGAALPFPEQSYPGHQSNTHK